jgi:hypothetical protein
MSQQLGLRRGRPPGHASFPPAGPAATAPVDITVVDTRPAAGAAGSVELTLEVSVDQTWFASPDRRFPLTVDPTYLRQTSDAGATDTFVSSGAPTTSYWTNPWLLVGSNGGPTPGLPCDPHGIEEFWRNRWEEAGIGVVDLCPTRGSALADRVLNRLVFVPGRLVNFVTAP